MGTTTEMRRKKQIDDQLGHFFEYGPRVLGLFARGDVVQGQRLTDRQGSH